MFLTRTRTPLEKDCAAISVMPRRFDICLRPFSATGLRRIDCEPLLRIPEYQDAQPPSLAGIQTLISQPLFETQLFDTQLFVKLQSGAGDDALSGAFTCATHCAMARFDASPVARKP